MSDELGVVGWVKPIFRNDRQQGPREYDDYDDAECTHETEDLCPTDDHNIWHLEDSYLEGESYWTVTDAAFTKCRTRVNEYKCFGCGEERTISSGEILEVCWKEDLTTEEIEEMHEEVNTGSWYNGQMWWEDNIWSGDPTKVAPPMAWRIEVGYTDWKEDADNPPRIGGENNAG